MNLKRNFFLVLLSTLCTLAIANDHFFDDGDEELDELALGETRIPFEPAPIRGMPSLFAGFALQDIPDVPSPQDVLLTPLYRRTNPIRRRNILDNEIFMNDSYATAPFTVTPFFNFTYKGCFNGNDTTIKNYLDLLQGDVPEEIQKLIVQLMEDEDGIDPQIKALFSALNIPDVLGLFNGIKAQEWQMGGMLRYVYDSHNDWKIDIRLPLIWQIYNFYLTSAEEANIKSQPIMQILGPEVDFMPFAKRHLISDKIGLGDMQVRYEVLMQEHPTSAWSLGVSLGIPTACAFKKGVYGSYFNKKAPAPDFELVRDIINLIENNQDEYAQVKENGGKLGLAVLDRISSVLLDHPLGRDGHWTIGAYYRSTIDFTPTLQLLSSAGFVCPLPGSEDRFIKTTITAEEVAALQALPVDTDEEATIALNTYNELLLRKLFPQSYKCTLFPGIIFISNSCIKYTCNKWILTLGSDMWAQTREHLMSIHAPYAQTSQLDSSPILNEYAYQTKTYVSIHYHNPESSWMYTATGGVTGITDRIGSSITLSFNIQRSF